MGILSSLHFAHSSLAQDWPQFLGPTHNGVYVGTNLARQWPKDGPPLLWRHKTGPGWASPVIVKGKVILFHRQNGEEVLEGLDSTTGKGLWRYGYTATYKDDFGFEDGPRSTPAIDGGRVFSLGADGMITCLDLDTGRRLWVVDGRKEFKAGKGFFGFASSPLVEAGKMLLNVGGGDGAGIVALNVSSGALIWKSTADEASYSSPAVGNLEGRRRGFFFTRAGLVILDPASGRVESAFPWRARMSASVNAATPLLKDDMVFLSASYQTGAVLLKVKPGKLEKIWSGDDIMSNHYSTCVESGGFLFGFDGRQEQGQTLKCLEWMTGKVRWEKGGLRAGTVTLAGKDLLVLTEAGELIRAVATPDSYKELGRFQAASGGVRAFPALADGRLYCRGSADLFCYDLTVSQK